MPHLSLIAISIITVGSFDAMAQRPLKDLSALSDISKYVTQHDGQPAFTGKYWNHGNPGFYVDVVSGRAALLIAG